MTQTEIAHLVEEAAAVIAIGGLVWRSMRRAARFIVSQVTLWTGFMRETNGHLANLNATLGKLGQDLEDIQAALAITTNGKTTERLVHPVVSRRQAGSEAV